MYFTFPSLILHADAPEIEVERSLIHTGVGYEAQLICIVHAEPQPHVIWYKDTTQLGTTEQHSQQVSTEVRTPKKNPSTHLFNVFMPWNW